MRTTETITTQGHLRAFNSKRGGQRAWGEPSFSACARQEVKLTQAHHHRQPGFPYKAGISQNAAPERCVWCFVLHIRLRSSSLLPLGMPEREDHDRERPCSNGTELNMVTSSPLPQPEHHGTDHTQLCTTLWAHWSPGWAWDTLIFFTDSCQPHNLCSQCPVYCV